MAESVRDIKKRIKSVKNIAQITKAMEAVAANKMRKSQNFAISARPYAVASLEMLENLLARTSALPAVFAGREVKNTLLVVVTADKGLAGAYNSNVLKAADKWVAGMKKSGKEFTLITVGKKAKDYFSRRKIVVAGEFAGFSDFSNLSQTVPVSKAVLDGFELGKWDEVYVVYTNFKTTLKQEVALRKILPITKDGVSEMVSGILPEAGKFAKRENIHMESQPSSAKATESKYSYEYVFEPSPEKIISALVPRLLHMELHHIILESNASEHSSRMVAMKNASDNAKEIIGDLTLVYNKVRQAGITREIIEITAGSEALR